MFSSGNSGVNLINQLQRIQSANYSAAQNRKFVNQYGALSPLDQVIVEAPTVSLNLDWIVADCSNTTAIGFVTNGTAGACSGIFACTTDDKNYFVLTVKEGSDAIGNSDTDSTKFTKAIGNGYLSNFTAEVSVGNFPVERVTVEGLNFETLQGSTGLPSPAVLQSNGQSVANTLFSIPTATSGAAGSVSALRPGDITLSLIDPVFGPKISDLKIQSYNLSVPLTRQAVSKLGSPFPFARFVNYPTEVTLSIEAEIGDLVTGQIASLFCNDTTQTITVNLASPQCGGGGPIAVQYKLIGAKLADQSYTSSFGQNQRVNLRYTSFIGVPSDQCHNLYISGVQGGYGE